MKNTFLTQKVFVAVLIAALFMCGCDNDNSDGPGQSNVERAESAEQKVVQNPPPQYNTVTKYHNGE